MDTTLFSNTCEELQQIHEFEVLELYKNELILKCLKKIKLIDLNVDDKSKKNIEKALLSVKISDYIGMGAENKLLGLDAFDHKNINLAYTEKKLIGELVSKEVQKVCKLATEFMKRHDLTALSKTQTELLNLEEKRSELLKNLIEVEKEKIELMKLCADIRVGPHQKNEIEQIYNESSIDEMRTKILKNTIIHGELTKTTFTKQAIAEVESKIDELLNEQNS
ncbi:unnamed protein product [Diamesa serratosioi]